jgi:hypothetical protein
MSGSWVAPLNPVRLKERMRTLGFPSHASAIFNRWTGRRCGIGCDVNDIRVNKAFPSSRQPKGKTNEKRQRLSNLDERACQRPDAKKLHLNALLGTESSSVGGHTADVLIDCPFQMGSIRAVFI